jgi:ribonuclease HI
MAKNYYAVRKGVKTGIFDNWAECQKSIEGFSGAEFKKFGKPEEAELYLSCEDKSQMAEKKVQSLDIPLDTIIAYIDGSFNKDINRYSFGCVLITPHKEIIRESGCGESPDAVALQNVAGELQGALYAAKWVITNGYKNIEIRHDYEGIAKWVVGEWKAKNPITKLYIEEMQKYLKKINISFRKVDAHTNDTFNEAADKLAKEALTSGKKAKISRGQTWFSVEGIKLSEIEIIIDLVKGECPELQVSNSDIPYGKRFELTIPKLEKIVIQYFNDKDTLSIQGKPQKLFSIVVTCITELVDIEEIPEFFNDLYSLEIDKENVKKEFRSYLPHASGRLPVKMEKVLHQAVYNLNITGDVFDATFLVEPILRVLEGHLKLVIKSNHIDMHETPESTKDTFHMFEKNGSRYQLRQEFMSTLNQGMKVYIGRCYTHYNYHRHSLCHWDDPTDVIDTTRLINNVNDAHRLIKDTLALIDEYYELA